MILTIIQARLGSTRLPGKILLPIAGKPMLQHVINAAPEPKVLAIPLTDIDVYSINRPINGIAICPRADSDDVLGRFHHAWKVFKPEADWILRLTADCPMLTMEIVEKFIDRSKSEIMNFPGDFKDEWPWILTNRPYDPDGYDMELFSVEALKMAHEHATEPYDREHICSWMYRHLNVRRFSVFGREPQPEDPSEKCSIDTMEDYEKVKALMETK